MATFDQLLGKLSELVGGERAPSNAMAGARNVAESLEPRVTYRAAMLPVGNFDDGSVGMVWPQSAVDAKNAFARFHRGEAPQPEDAVLAGLAMTGAGAFGLGTRAGRVSGSVAGAERAEASSGLPSHSVEAGRSIQAEYPASAATKYGDKIYPRRAHGMEDPGPDADSLPSTQGFVTNTGRFVTREEAATMLKAIEPQYSKTAANTEHFAFVDGKPWVATSPSQANAIVELVGADGSVSMAASRAANAAQKYREMYDRDAPWNPLSRSAYRDENAWLLDGAARHDATREALEALDGRRVQLSGPEHLPSLDGFFANPKEAAPTGMLAMDAASRMERAKAMGFDPETTWYHGTGDDFSEFKPGSPTYMTTDPAEASRYADIKTRYSDNPTPAVYPLNTRGKFATSTDLAEAEKALGGGYQHSRDVNVELARRGFDGYRDGDFSYVFDPKNIRSTNAAFDPAQSDSANLLASNPPNAAPAGLLATGESNEHHSRAQPRNPSGRFVTPDSFDGKLHAFSKLIDTDGDGVPDTVVPEAGASPTNAMAALRRR